MAAVNRVFVVQVSERFFLFPSLLARLFGGVLVGSPTSLIGGSFVRPPLRRREYVGGAVAGMGALLLLSSERAMQPNPTVSTSNDLTAAVDLA